MNKTAAFYVEGTWTLDSIGNHIFFLGGGGGGRRGVRLLTLDYKTRGLG